MQVEIFLAAGQAIRTSMDEREINRLTNDFAGYVTSDQPANSGGVYNGNEGGAPQSVFVSFEHVAAIVVHGMAAS